MARAALVDHLASDARRIGHVLVAGPAASVAACPGWTVADLVRHHGGVMRWATRIVETGKAAVDDASGPAALTELADWYADGAARLIEALDRADPERDCWTFDRPPRKAWFWTRRQALEAAIHRWDAQHAIGPTEPIPSDVCIAGIEEVVDDLYPRQVALERTPPLSRPILLLATDVDSTWRIPGPAGDGAAAVEIAGPLEALLLLLWRRTGVDDGLVDYIGPAPLRPEIASTLFAP